MNCREWEEPIALYLGGESRGVMAAEAERHLRDCAGCQVFASGMKETLALLDEAHREVPAEVHFAAVRARVMAEVARQGRPLWRRAWVYAVASAVLIGAALAGARVWRTVEPLPAVALARPAVVRQALELPRIAARKDGATGSVPSHERERVFSAKSKTILLEQRTNRRVAPQRSPGETVLVRLVTDDPDVVIYWIADRKGD
jgi:hypothetical protein